MQRVFITSIIFVMMLTSVFAQQAETAFIISEPDLIPEGIAYDAVGKTFYVSSIHKKKIVKISGKGEVADFVLSGADEIQETLGMKVDGQGLLWVCNNTSEHDSINKISNVHVYNTKTKSLFKRYQLKDGQRHLFNDLYIANSGDVFITDTEAGMIWIIRKEKNILEEFLKPASIAYPNGICSSADGKNLIVTAGNGFVLVDIESKEITPIQNDRYVLMGYDGIYLYKNNVIAVQNMLFPEAIHKLKLNEKGNAIEKAEFLVTGNPELDLPTTGVIAGDYFYFIANSQLLQIIGSKGKIKQPEKLKDVVILKIKLN